MSEIRVNFGSLSEGQAGIMKTHGELVSNLDDLNDNLQPMLASWDGEAREAYHECKKEWDAAAADMAATLAQIGKLVGTANSNYAAAEKSAANMWR